MLQRALVRKLLMSLLVVSLFARGGRNVATAKAEAMPRVSIGEVVVASEGNTTNEPTPQLNRTLRAALQDALSGAPELTKLRRPLVVSVTLTRLSSERHHERTKASAAISLALRRADDQVLFAELCGRASVEETTNDPALLRKRALEGAVRGAVARLSEAAERTR
jgi:hypothetical protein